MRNKNIVSCALDIGSGRIKAALGKYKRRENLFEILALEEVYPTGIKGGSVSDMAACTQAIVRVLEKIESKAGERFDYLFLTVPNSHINLDFARGVCLLEKEGRITAREIQRAVRSSVEFYLPLNRKLVEVAVREYVVDGQRGISNPVGMFGKKIEVETILLHSPLQVLSNIIAAVEEAGYTINELVACSQAQAEFLLTRQQREIGGVILDIGEERSSIACFKNGFISQIKRFNIGVNEITKGISSFFQIPYEYAQGLNERYFSLSAVAEKSNENFLLKRENEKYESILKRDFCLKGIESSEGLFSVITEYLHNQEAVSNIVFCGGAALIDGFTEKMEDYKLDTKIGKLISDKIKFSNPSFNNPLFLNSICACVYGFELLRQRRREHFKDLRLLGKFIFRIKDLMEEYF